MTAGALRQETFRSLLGLTGYLFTFVLRSTSITAPLRKLTQKHVALEMLKESITNDKTIIFFIPNKAIVVRVKASYHDRFLILLSSGLFQDIGKGLQPVHFTSQTMTDTENTYSQTETDALAVQCVKNTFRIYIKGVPRFQIITGRKQLLSMFNKVTANLPPRRVLGNGHTQPSAWIAN